MNKTSFQRSLWSVWWAAIDRWTFGAILILVGVGIWLIMAASPAVALQHRWSSFVLLKRHFMMVGPGLALLILTSFSRKEPILLIARMMGLLAWIGIWAVLGIGPEIKGAKRWLSVGGLSLQPSEFLKPALAVMTAHILSQDLPTKFLWVGGLLALVVVPLFLQPDLGMIFLIGSVWFLQCFVAGLPWPWTLGACGGAVLGGIFIYLCFPHAAHRIHLFLAGGTQDPFGSHYQICQALKSFAAGGILGKGPGAGTIVNSLPDGHADFIFAVAGEELGLLACLMILGLYGVIIFRSLWHAFQEEDTFYFLAIVGLIGQFALQVIFNIASVLHVMPTKGMTLPFLSYGGSSFLSLCWAMGMLVAFTRRYRGLT